MRRTFAAWLVALPAAAGGVLAAHAAAYALAGHGAHAAHGYLPLAQALVCGALALGLAAATASARSGRLARPSALVFALAPPLAFLLQETAERGFAPPFERVVLLGLLLQLPFALLAYVAARVLLRVAELLVAPRALGHGRPRAPLPGRPAPPPHSPHLVAARGRAPPRPIAST